MMRTLRLLLVVAGLMATATAQAQPLSTGVVSSPVVTIEPDRLFAESAFGKRVLAETEARGTELAAENRRIEAELTEEERALAAQRPNLAQNEFRALAEAFDEKVEGLRQEQDAKAVALTQFGEDARRSFLLAARPALETLLQDVDAVAIVDRRAVFLSLETIDITDQAIARIDAVLGDGTASGRPASP